jgi:hypothetical protein
MWLLVPLCYGLIAWHLIDIKKLLEKLIEFEKEKKQMRG